MSQTEFKPTTRANRTRQYDNEYAVIGDEARLTIRRKSDGTVVGVSRFDASDMLEVGRFYWSVNLGYAVAVCQNQTCVPMHRILVGVWHDHKNRDRMDNRRCNLRPTTFANNVRNRNRNKTNTSRFKGVTFWRPNQKWGARIKVDNKSRFLGLFTDEESAARAYDAAAREAWGEFAGCNFN